MSTAAVCESPILAAVDKVPTFPVVLAAFTQSLWFPSLAQLSASAAHVTTLAVCLLTVIKLWQAFMRPASGNTMASGFANAAKVASKVFLPLGILLAGVAAIVWASGSAKAAPAIVPAAVGAAKTGKKRKSADDAGEDGDVDSDEAPEGAPKWYTLGREMLGLCERLPNGRSNPEVAKMYVHSGYKNPQDARAVPWCMVWINYLLHLCGLKGSGRPNARSALTHPNFRRIKKPFVGCFVVIWRGKKDDGVTAHVFQYVGETATHWIGLGANQGDKVSVAKFPKRRGGRDTLLGFSAPKRWYHDKSAIAEGVGVAGSVGAGGAVAAEVATATETAPPSVSTSVSETVGQIKEPLREAAQALPDGSKWKLYLVGGLIALTLLAVAFAWYERRKTN